MKILVYGAGVLGCNLARNLFHAGKDVTLLARGNWAEEIRKNGLRIKDQFSLRTSVSNIPVVWRQDNRDVFAFSLSWFEHSKGVEDINYLVAYPPWFIPLNLNLRNHFELSIAILRLLNFILNFRSWVDKSPHHFESELCIIPHLKIAKLFRLVCLFRQMTLILIETV